MVRRESRIIFLSSKEAYSPKTRSSNSGGDPEVWSISDPDRGRGLQLSSFFPNPKDFFYIYFMKKFHDLRKIDNPEVGVPDICNQILTGEFPSSLNFHPIPTK